MTDDHERTDPGAEFDPDPASSSSTTAHDDEEPGRLPSHVAGSLCYVMSFASGLVFLILETEDRTVRFHAFQSILLGATSSILLIWAALLGLIPFLGPPISWFIKLVVGLAWLMATLFLIAKAYSGEAYRLPYLGPRAAKLAMPYSETD